MNSLAPAFRGLFTFLLLWATSTGKGQLLIHQNQAPTTLVQNVLLGGGVFGFNISFNAYPGTTLPFGEEGTRFGRFEGSNCNVGLDGGIILFTGDAMLAVGPNYQEVTASGGFAFNSTYDRDLCQLSGSDSCPVIGNNNLVYNKSVLEFDFMPINDMVSFRYVFSSEEYERWTCMEYNDTFGMLISGPGILGPFQDSAMNIAFVPGSMSTVSVNSVNSGLNANNANGTVLGPFEGCYAADPNWMDNTPYYIYNGSQVQGAFGGPQTEEPYCCDPYYIQHNGLTVVLTASAAVQIGQTYHMKMAIGNIGDWRIPSAVYIEQGSFAAGDRFTCTVDEGPNVNLGDTVPILYESDVDSVFLRFNRWGGFYLDEYLQVAVEGDAVAGLDYLPTLPDSIHFNQLDSAAVLPIAIPVRSDQQRELIINLITSNGYKVMSHRMIIAPEGTVDVVDLQRPLDRLSLFPNPATGTLHVSLPEGMQGRTDLQVLDMAGRIVTKQSFNNIGYSTLDVSGLPNGLYTVKAETQGRIATARVNVRH